MFTIIRLITLISVVTVKTIAMHKSYFADKSNPENEITDFIYSKGYLPNENELPKSTVIKNVENDATYLLSKLSDNELVKLLNDQPNKKSYDLDDIIKITLGGKPNGLHTVSVMGRDFQDEVNSYSNKRFRITPDVENNQRAYFKLNHKPIIPNNQQNDLNFLALKKLHNLLNYRPENNDLTEEKRELLFDILVSQLKMLCCKNDKQSRVQNLQIANNIFPNDPNEKSYLTDFKASSIQKNNEYMFLIVNEEIKSKSNDDLVFVDPESLEKNSSILLLGPITTPLTDVQLKVIMDRISIELSKPEYASLLQQLSDGTLDDSLSMTKNYIFGRGTRRYIKPHRCNYQSRLAKIYGGPRWLICTGYLNLNTPSLYD